MPTPTPAGPVVPGQFLGVKAPLEPARFAVLLLPFEKTTSYRKGTAQGPARFIEGSLGLELWDEELRRRTYRAGIHTLRLPTRGQGAAAYFPRVQAAAAGLLDRGKTVFSIGGEHSLSQALIPAFLRRHPGLSVLHFDAHADLRPSYAGSPFSHACALYPASRRCPVVQVGIRSIGEDEAHLVNAGNVVTFPMHEHRDLRSLLPKVLRALTDTVYLSIDLDGFDPSVIPGVGTPQPGGFSWYEGLDILRGVIKGKRVVGVDVMELCPIDGDVSSELAAAKLVYRLMGYL
ncbi:MAG: agmatinase [Elusimicrobia bacterium]|nr:agmatinase [Elusimicrobiota bacterium]